MGVGDRIRLARESKKLSQADLGRLLGRGQTTVAGYEAGKAEPDLETILRIAQKLGFTPQWLAFGSGAPEPTDDGSEGSVSRDIITQSVVEFERVRRAEALTLTPHEVATFVLVVHDMARKEGGAQMVRPIIERLLAKSK